MKIEAFTDKVAEAYGATDVQTVVQEGAAFVSRLINEMEASMRYKVGEEVDVRGSDEDGSVIVVGPMALFFRPYPEQGQLEVLIQDQQKNRETYDLLEVPEGEAILWSPRFRHELSKEVFEYYLDVFRPLLP